MQLNILHTFVKQVRGSINLGIGFQMRLSDCHNFMDFRKLAKKRLPSPIFNYIDGAADDEKTYRRNTQSFDDCDLIPNILQGTDEIDMSVEVLGQKLQLPIYCSPCLLYTSPSPRD